MNESQQTGHGATVRPFDPAAGRQGIWTGVIGGLFALVMCSAYAIYKAKTLPNGGPNVFECLSWMPSGYSFRFINRNYFDVLGVVALSFTLMVTWETRKDPFRRAATLLAAACGVFMAWSIALGSKPFINGPTLSFIGWPWTDMEACYVICGGAVTAIWASGLSSLRMGKYRLAPAGWALKTAFYRWFTGLCVFGALMLVFLSHPFYGSGYYENWRITVSYLFTIYALAGLPYAFITNLLRKSRAEDRKDPGFVALIFLRAAVKSVARKDYSAARRAFFNRSNLVTARDTGVKFFFVPLMLTFLFMEASGLFDFFPKLYGQAAMILGATPSAQSDTWPWWALFDYFYASAFHGIFLMDVSISLVGYICSSRWLDNKSKSVDPTLSGWLAALVCYPPFNGLTTNYLPYDRNFHGAHILDFTHLTFLDPAYAAAMNNFAEFGLRLTTLCAFTVYVWATMAFGLRFSNLTNRGIITRGPYAFIRHPAYIAKNIAWWSENVRNFASPWQFVFLAVWNIIYFLRAVTEERHLKSDPDYAAYCGHVKHRFIPGFW
ncbi:MAG: hypothetical protein HZB29_09085 [Nitrospinae bacterium]|nr:hypothetical protein [Nitrospinota bacterium]